MTRKTPKRKQTKSVASSSVERGDNVPHKHGASLEDFVQFRQRLNVEILNEGNLVINRFFALDTRTYEAGALDIFESLSVGLIVGGSIVIPHLRRAVDRWSELERLAQ